MQVLDKPNCPILTDFERVRRAYQDHAAKLCENHDVEKAMYESALLRLYTNLRFIVSLSGGQKYAKNFRYPLNIRERIIFNHKEFYAACQFQTLCAVNFAKRKLE